jgi:hypothetical protein
VIRRRMARPARLHRLKKHQPLSIAQSLNVRPFIGELHFNAQSRLLQRLG